MKVLLEKEKGSSKFRLALKIRVRLILGLLLADS
jgi:hypothetical protein